MHSKEKAAKNQADKDLQSRLVRAGKQSMLQALGNAVGNKRKQSGSHEGESPPKKQTGSRRVHALKEALEPIAAVLKLSVEATDRHAQRMCGIAEQNVIIRRQHLEHQREVAKNMNVFRQESAKFDRVLAAVAAGASFTDAMRMFN